MLNVRLGMGMVLFIWILTGCNWEDKEDESQKYNYGAGVSTAGTAATATTNNYSTTFWTVSNQVLKADSEKNIVTVQYASPTELSETSTVELLYSDDRLGNQNLISIAKNIPFSKQGFSYDWNTKDIPEGLYSLHVNISQNAAAPKTTNAYDGKYLVTFSRTVPTSLSIPNVPISIIDGKNHQTLTTNVGDLEVDVVTDIAVSVDGNMDIDLHVLNRKTQVSVGIGTANGKIDANFTISGSYYLVLDGGNEVRGTFNGSRTGSIEGRQLAHTVDTVSASATEIAKSKSRGSVSVIKTTANDTPVYYGDVQKILNDNCQICHRAGGGGHPEFYNYATTKAQMNTIKFYVRHGGRAENLGYMPPFFAADNGQRFVDYRGLKESEIRRIESWVDTGGSEGDSKNNLAYNLTTTASPTGEKWDGNVPKDFKANDFRKEGEDDVYRCFVFDPGFKQTTYITGSNIVPGSAIVHHVIVYAIGPDIADQVLQLDKRDAGEGYSCFSGPLEGQGSATKTQNVGGWVPGAKPVDWKNKGFKLDPGTVFSVQLHYYLEGEELKKLSDNTKFQLWYTNLKPTTLIKTVPMVDLDLNIPAKSTGHLESQTRDLWSWTKIFIKDLNDSSQLVIHSAYPHAHLKAQEISLNITRKDGTQTPVIKIPRYNFNWQGSYPMKDTIGVNKGDQGTVQCVFDNPTDKIVHWGEGTNDEMCLVYMTLSWEPIQ